MLMRLLELGSGRVCKGRDPPRPPCSRTGLWGTEGRRTATGFQAWVSNSLGASLFLPGRVRCGVRALGLGPGFRDLGEDASSSWGKEWVGNSCKMPPPRVLGIKPVSFQELFCPEAALSSCGPPNPQPASDPEVGRGQRC